MFDQIFMRFLLPLTFPTAPIPPPVPVVPVVQSIPNALDRRNPFDDPVVRDAWTRPITPDERVVWLESKIRDTQIRMNGSPDGYYYLLNREYRRQLHNLHNRTSENSEK